MENLEIQEQTIIKISTKKYRCRFGSNPLPYPQ
ncbi:conserved hypothetical protein [Vibrio cholerae O395]|nr:conserved hypothetical protein [Vibrio cholerae O395]